MVIEDKNAVTQVIGSLMKNCLLLAEQDKYNLTVSDFSDLFTRGIFSSIRNLYAQGAKTVSIVDIDLYIQNIPDVRDTFEKQHGLDYLKDCEELCNPDNFDYYYNRLKKFSCLRQMQKAGFSIDNWYCDNPLAPRAGEIQERFEDASLQDILTDYKIRLADIEKQYLTSQLNQTGYIGDGLRELIASFEKHPEVGYALGGDMYNDIVQGARLGKYYIRSAGSGDGKTRLAVGEAAKLAIPKFYDPDLKQWVDTGLNQKVLFITTELDRDEVQTMLVAYVSGVNERKILRHLTTKEEEKVVEQAINIVECFSENLIIDKIPDPSISQIETCIRNHVLVDGVKYVFYDYIFSSPSLFAEFQKSKVREDVCLLMLSTALKDLATELDIFVSSATQLSGDFKVQTGVRDQSFIRSSKSVADKCDVGSILVRVYDDEMGKIQPIIDQYGLPKPTHVIDIYKNRRSEYTQVKIWCSIDLGTCRERDLFVTDGHYNMMSAFNERTYRELKKKQNFDQEKVIEVDFSPIEEEKESSSSLEVNTPMLSAPEASLEPSIEEETPMASIPASAIPKNEEPPFPLPFEMSNASGSTYVDNIVAEKKPIYTSTPLKKGRLSDLL